MSKRLLVIVPAYNEEGSIEKVVTNIGTANSQYDIVVINDCSTDRTSEILEKTFINHVDLPINLGIGGAMQTGYLYALDNKYDYAVQVDGDGQHDPKEIIRLVAKMESGKADMIIGSRFVEKTEYNQKIMRMLGINMFSLVTRFLIGQSIKDSTSGFRLVNHRVIKYFAENYPTDYPEPEVLVGLTRRGFKIVEIPVRMHLRETGVSSINSLRSVYYMAKVFFAMLIEKIRKV